MRLSGLFAQTNLADVESGVSQPDMSGRFHMQEELGSGNTLTRSKFR